MRDFWSGGGQMQTQHVGAPSFPASQQPLWMAANTTAEACTAPCRVFVSARTLLQCVSARTLLPALSDRAWRAAGKLAGFCYFGSFCSGFFL